MNIKKTLAILGLTILLAYNVTAADTNKYVFAPVPAVAAEVSKIDEHGYKYVLVFPEEITNNIYGAHKCDLWERIQPLDTNVWYTLSTRSKIISNSPVHFDVIFK